MELNQLLSAVQAHAGFREAVDALRGDGRRRTRLSIADAAKAYLLAALADGLALPVLVLTARPAQARALRDELACWHSRPDAVVLFPELDVLPLERLPPDPQTTAERLAVLTKLSALGYQSPAGEGEAVAGLVVVACERAAADLLRAPEEFERASVRVRVGEQIRPEELLRQFLELGYEPAPTVDSPGQYGRRGGIVDIYPLVGQPCRIEFFGDEVESLRYFDPLSQRSTERVEQLLITPSAETAPSARGTLVDYLPAQAVLVLDEPESIGHAAREFEEQVAGLRTELVARGEADAEPALPYLEWSELRERMERSSGRLLELVHDPDQESVPFQAPPAFGGRLRHFVQECDRLAAAGQRVVVVSQQSQRLAELLADRTMHSGNGSGPVTGGGPAIVHGQLQAGWQSSELGLTLFTDSEIFGWQKIRRPTRPRRVAGRRTFLSELTPGDLVVHVEHGIAYYRGLVTMAAAPRAPDGATVEGTEREYLLLEYAEGGRVYVPADQADRVSRYIGAGESQPTPTKLGSGEWARAKSRVRRAVREIANDLLELYAAREQAQGYPFPSDSLWQTELESSFPYVETGDQLRALAEVKEDMERPRPMDRLLVGDVGYGKTEVALRAAFKAVEAGKQVAVLVPTTILAQQHWNTFRERLAAFPVRIEMLSRFRSDSEQRAVVRGLAEGSVDIVIGTHRLLQKDVRLKELGLVIIDEEQRFGVAHKERLKQLRREVDVLTLSATPIPRTMHMALVGVRDMSTIETPPEERLPIRTYVTEYDQGLIREAILREMDRGGQVYYVHNRVQSIAVEAAHLQRLVPEARIVVGHGQMPEEQLERAMLEFAAGEHDVLVCTTIIESGLDIPSVNTLIVNNAHRFGLSQLYQLRGRVGRAAARAYAYFLYTKDTALTETAEQRLRTIFEATELGAGFRIALKDLEIRGAGNLLGADQHGHISAVGFDLYTRLLAESVSQLKEAQALVRGEQSEERRPAGTFGGLTPAALEPGPSISLPLPAYLTAEYIEDEPTRLNFYQRLAAVVRGPDLAELVDELVDRFGPLPEAVQNLIYIVSLRLEARRAGLQAVQSLDGEVVLRFERLPRVDVAELSRAVGTNLRAGSNQIRLPRGRGSAWTAQLRTLIESLPNQSGQPVLASSGRRSVAGP